MGITKNSNEYELWKEVYTLRNKYSGIVKDEESLKQVVDETNKLFEKYEDVAIVLMRYSGNAKKIAEYKDNKTDCSYVDDVLTRAAAFERQHGK